MKRIFCFFIILTHVSFAVVFAQTQNFTPRGIKPQPERLAEGSDVKPVTTEVRVKSEKVKKPSVVKESNGQPCSDDVQDVKQDAAQGAARVNKKVCDQNPLRKIARGAVNATLGWTEIPRQVVKVNKDGGDIAGAFWGPLKGFAFFIGRTAVGVYEVTTFLLPPYKPVVNPEFIFSEDEDN